jgi:hypothetical protein
VGEDHVVFVLEQMRTGITRNLRNIACDRQDDRIGNGTTRANTSVYVKQTQSVIPRFCFSSHDRRQSPIDDLASFRHFDDKARNIRA